MKKLMKKMMATVAALSVAAAGSALSVSAAADEANLNIKDKVEAKPGDTVSVDIYIDGDSDLSVNSLAMRIVYDNGIKLKNVKVPGGAPQLQEIDAQTMFFTSSTGDASIALKDKAVVATLEFEVSKEAEAKEYAISISDKNFKFRNTDVSLSTDVKYKMDTDGANGGSIVVKGEETTVTTVTTVTTPTPTTEAITTTTAVSAATEAPASTAATTVSSTSDTKSSTTTTKVTSAPVTGNSSTGIAALAATMIAAAGTAIVLKKKKD